jgi:hypothetical protein
LLLTPFSEISQVKSYYFNRGLMILVSLLI